MREKEGLVFSLYRVKGHTTTQVESLKSKSLKAAFCTGAEVYKSRTQVCARRKPVAAWSTRVVNSKANAEILCGEGRIKERLPLLKCSGKVFQVGSLKS